MGNMIVLANDMFEPRANFKFCHELAHILLGHQSHKTITLAAEKEADEYASELLLPSREFREEMGRHDLAGLKKVYSHASWEAIARKWAELHPGVLTIFDDRKLHYRRAPDGLNYPFKVTQVEQEVVTACYDNRYNHSVETDQLVINGYYVDEGQSVKIVILLTEIKDIVY